MWSLAAPPQGVAERLRGPKNSRKSRAACPLARLCSFFPQTGCCQGQRRQAREQVKTGRLAAATSSPTLLVSLQLSSVHLPLRVDGGPSVGQEQVGLAVCRPPPGLLVGHRSRPFPQPSSTRRGQHRTSPSPFISPCASLHRSRQHTCLFPRTRPHRSRSLPATAYSLQPSIPPTALDQRVSDTLPPAPPRFQRRTLPLPTTQPGSPAAHRDLPHARLTSAPSPNRSPPPPIHSGILPTQPTLPTPIQPYAGCDARQNFSPRGTHIPPRRPAAGPQLPLSPTTSALPGPTRRLPPPRRLPHRTPAHREEEAQNVHPQYQVDLGLPVDSRHPGRHRPRPRSVRVPTTTIAANPSHSAC